MNRVQVARAVFAVASSGTLLAIALLGAGPFEDPSHPSTLPPWAFEPALNHGGVPVVQSPLLPATAMEPFAISGYPKSAIWPVRSTAPWPSTQPQRAPQPPLMTPLTQATSKNNDG